MTDNPFDAIRRLETRMKEVAESLDLELVQFVIVPEPNGTNACSAIFHITPEAVRTAAEIETEKTNEAFADLMSDFEVLTDEEGNLVVQGPDSETEEREKKAVDEAERALKEREEQIKKKMKEWIVGETDDV